ncbi:putative glutathione s-transferase [Nicotiana attenuata]|uniref:Glutathione S-transferase n=1 Tax=Nicotiana attenuata TaxID=49451 RepID=A0A1J6KCN7_NICAT|nr:putative glutathione s-transferase [Nicotiana attenuata]
MSSKDDLRLLDFWASSFCMRVKIALAEKGLTYESLEEDLFGGKSEFLLKSNPIYAEADPGFQEDGCTVLFEAGMRIWKSKGEEVGVAKKDFIEMLKKLEGGMVDKDYLGGDNFEYVDVIAITMTSWFHAYEVFGGFKVEEECPKFACWIKRCL